MQYITYESLINRKSLDSNMGTSSIGNIDKGGRCYHVITQIRDRSRIITRDIGSYRHSLLCQLCNERNVIIVFSVTMPSHTHDVLIAEDWHLISEIYKIVDQTLSRRLRQKGPDWIKDRAHILGGRPYYKAVYSTEYLFYLGKYIFDNAKTIHEAGKSIPDSCFWMFEKDHLTPPYNRDVYKLLFGYSPSELFEIYSTNSAENVRKLSSNLFGGMTEQQNRAIYVNPAAKPTNQK